MLLRYPSDRRTLAWALAMPVVALLPYVRPELAVWLWPLSCYLALSAGVIAHNHNHTPTFRGRKLNAIFGNWLSIFYGYPTYAWVPTHNLNHHKFVNKAGDATITWRFTNKHNALVAGTYFFVSSYYQAEPIKDYIRKAKEKNPQLYRTIIGQYVFFVGTHLALLALAVALHGWKTGFQVWGLMFLVPALFALWTIMFFNYIQHVHTDPWSEHNHSRSWISPVLNFLLFNNGYHSAHHELAGAPLEHVARAAPEAGAGHRSAPEREELLVVLPPELPPRAALPLAGNAPDRPGSVRRSGSRRRRPLRSRPRWTRSSRA